MPTITLSQLRDTRQLKDWLKAGKTVELRERDRVIGRIVPKPKPPQSGPVEYPDFEARAKAILGDRILPNAVIKERRRSRY